MFVPYYYRHLDATLTVYISLLCVLSGQDKTTLTVYNCVLGVLSGQGKTTLTVYVCVRCAFRSR